MEEQNINEVKVQESIINKKPLINRVSFYGIVIILNIIIFNVLASSFLSKGAGFSGLDNVFYLVGIEFILTILSVISYEIYRYKKDEKASFKPLIIIVLIIIAIIIYFIKLTGIFSNNFNVVGY